MLEASRHCPRQSLPAEIGGWIDLHGMFENGHLAVAGGALEQPAYYVQAMKVIGNAMKDAQSDG